MKSAPKPPKPIDPTALSNTLTGSNIDTAVAQQALNMTDKTNPFGSTNYTQTGTVDVNGHPVPTYSQNTTLSAPLQSLLGSIEAGANATGYGPLDTSHLPALTDPTLLSQQTSDAVYNQAKSRLDPEWDQTQRRLDAQLALQGIAPGSEAYGQAVDSYGRARNDAYTSAQNSATESGVRDASQLYQDILAGRQQGINEQVTSQNQPLSLLTQIMSGTAPMTNAQTPQASVQTPDILGAYGLNASQQQNAYQAKQNSYASTLGGLGSLAGNALMFAML